MTRVDLVNNVREEAGVTAEVAKKAVDAVLDGIVNGLVAGEEISLKSFGTFSVKTRAARMGRNPKTGEPLSIAEAKLPNLKFSKEVRKQLQK